MGRRSRQTRRKITLTLTSEVLDQLDDFLEEFNGYVNRSGVINEILEAVLDDEDYLEEIFPENEEFDDDEDEYDDEDEEE